MALMGIDLGSSGCKAVVFDETGTVLSSAQAPYSAKYEGSFVEMDPEAAYAAFVSAVKEAAGSCDQTVQALAIASHGESYIPVDANNKAVGNYIMNADNRATEQSDKMEAVLGAEDIYYRCGAPIHPMFALMKIMWQKEHSVGAARYLGFADYIACRLGLGTVTDYSLASRFMGFDVAGRCWSQWFLDAAGVAESELPVPVQAGTPIGALSEQVAATLGLPVGTIICAGGHDQPCGALGAGVIKGGNAGISAGSYECIAVSSDEPLCTKKAYGYKLNSYCHVVPEKYVTLAFSPGALVVQWFVEQFCVSDAQEAQKSGISVYEFLNEKASTVPHPTGVCVTPHLVGACNPNWDVRATTVMAGLTPSVSRHAVYKSIFEGIACELALNARAIGEVAGEIGEFLISGGGANYPFSVELRAALTGKPISRLKTSEAVCQGAAMLAGIGAGVFKDCSQAVESMVSTVSKILPSADLAKQYRVQTERYATLFDGLSAFREIR